MIRETGISLKKQEFIKSKIRKTKYIKFRERKKKRDITKKKLIDRQ